MSGYRILIVDDDQATHDVVGTYLRLAGYRVHGCLDGSEATQAATATRPDLILLDIQMRKLNGFETIKVLRSNTSLRDIPVLFLSSLSRDDFKVKGLELGAEDYVTKPYSKPELLARIRATLRRSQRYKRTAGVLQGSLAEIGLATLLQTLELGRKSGVIRIPDLDAELGIASGSLTHIRFGTFDDDAALARIMFIDDGDFSIALSATDTTSTTDPRSTMGALMGAMRSVDEARRTAGRVFDDNPLLEIGETAHAYPLLAQFAELSPVLADTLITRMTGTIEQNAGELRRALDEGLLTVFGNHPPPGEAT